MLVKDAQAWAERWRAFELAEIVELRDLPVEMKLRQLDALAQSASLFDWASADEENERVREMWTRLRERSGVR